MKYGALADYLMKVSPRERYAPEILLLHAAPLIILFYLCGFFNYLMDFSACLLPLVVLVLFTTLCSNAGR